MKNICISDFKAVKTAVHQFATGQNKELKVYPLFDLLRADFAETPWPGNEYSIVYVIFDISGNALHVGTTESPGVGLGNYFSSNPDGTCRPKGNWEINPAYLQVFGVGKLTGGVEAAEDYDTRFALRAYLQQILAQHHIKPWFRSLRDLLLTVTPDRMTDRLPWLVGSRQLEELCRVRSMLLKEKLLSVKNTDRYCILAEAVDFDLDFLPAVDCMAEIFDVFDEGFICRVDRKMKDISWMMNLRVYRTNEKIEDWQFFLFVMKIWFDIKLNVEDEE